jgi:hypothetical protein
MVFTTFTRQKNLIHFYMYVHLLDNNIFLIYTERIIDSCVITGEIEAIWIKFIMNDNTMNTYSSGTNLS